MGLYINPTDGTTKEQFLEEYGSKVAINEFLSHIPGTKGIYGVALVDNGPFTAAGVAYDGLEAARFTRNSDKRPKMFFLVSAELLRPVCNGWNMYVKE